MKIIVKKSLISGMYYILPVLFIGMLVYYVYNIYDSEIITQESFDIETEAIKLDELDYAIIEVITHINFNNDSDTARHNFREFVNDVAIMESSLNNDAVNRRSTSKGMLQYTNGAYKTAKIRYQWYDNPEWLKEKKVTALSYVQQTSLMMIDLYQQSGTSEYMELIADGNKWAMTELYCNNHNTRCDKKERKIFYNILSHSDYITYKEN